MNRQAEQALRIATLQLLIEHPDIDMYPTVEVWQDGHPIPEFRKLHSQLTWKVASREAGIYLESPNDPDFQWEDLYKNVQTAIAATQAYNQAQDEADRMKAQSEQKEGQA